VRTVTPRPQVDAAERVPGVPSPPPALQAEIDRLVAAVHPQTNARVVRELLTAAVALCTEDVDRLDLKIATAALAEMREAFKVFAPYEDVSKVTIFGSARTRPDDPLYEQARRVAELLAGHGWMVVTGAGPGIMAAGMEGAGRERSIGVSIRLPWEQEANSIIAGDRKYVSMRYFFTRKLMLVKESKAFISLPGGFGTLDETFELLTLTQTGKGVPVPIVFLDMPGDTYWKAVRSLIDEQLVTRGLVSPSDLDLFLVTDDCAVATQEILHFYANYHSLRYVGDQLLIRLRQAPDDGQLALLNERFGHLCLRGRIERSDALSIETREGDAPGLPRLRFTFARHGFAELRSLIDTLNDWVEPSR
jgi:uncharacterized protein (TIGR00730 family)